MPEHDPILDLRDIPRGFALLTRLPVPGADGARMAAAAWAWPLVGAGVGVLAGVMAWGALAVGLPTAAAAGLALATATILTGGLHEDGLADCADGFWGGHDPDARLSIMKDSRIGSYGVLALVFGLGLKWVLLTAVLDLGALWAAVIVPAALSRGAMTGTMALMPFAREDGLAALVGRPAKATAGLASLLAIFVAGVGLGSAGLFAALCSVGAACAVAAVALRKIGGQTGDVLGAGQVLTELAALAALAAVLT